MRRSGFIEPCQPSKVARPPSGPLWVHEIKHDGYRLMVRRDGSRVSLLHPQRSEMTRCVNCRHGLPRHDGLLVIEHSQEQDDELKRAIAAIVLVLPLPHLWPLARSRMRLMRMPEATTQRPCVLFVHWPMMATLRPSSISG